MTGSAPPPLSRRSYLIVFGVALLCLLVAGTGGWVLSAQKQRETQAARAATVDARSATAQVADPLLAACAKANPLGKRLRVSGLCGNARKAKDDATPARGAEGPTGEAGAAGATGSRGPQGAAGAAGATGQTITGPAGPQGPKGDTGETGPAGRDGKDGADSTVPGPQGATGAAGAAGATGKDGRGVTDISCNGLVAGSLIFTYSDGTSQTVDCSPLP